MLRILDLSYCLINDQVAIHFAHALVNNTMLQVLDLSRELEEEEEEDVNDFAAFSQMLCNKSNILGTYQSNHTLERLSSQDLYGNGDESHLPADVLSLLRINRENSVSQAARIKIINTHFSGSEINMLPFMEINLNVRPHAVAWMAKDMHVYELLRAMPSLLERIDKNVRSKCQEFDDEYDELKKRHADEYDELKKRHAEEYDEWKEHAAVFEGYEKPGKDGGSNALMESLLMNEKTMKDKSTKRLRL